MRMHDDDGKCGNDANVGEEWKGTRFHHPALILWKINRGMHAAAAAASPPKKK